MRGIDWAKTGHVFAAEGQRPWMAHHTSPPVPDLRADGVLRLYFGTRDEQGRNRTGFVDTDPADPRRVQRVSEEPALGLGERGTFDDSGAMPAAIVDTGNEKHLFYTGWMLTVAVPHHTAIGVAVSTDGGDTFTRRGDGPILDRTPEEPYFSNSPFVSLESGGWRMWYGSGTGWIDVDGKLEPVYAIKYAESDDGVLWRRENITCIAQRDPEEAVGRPWVLRDGDRYRMWFVRRGSRGFRTDLAASYRIGYAESADGVVWERLDDDAGIDVSAEGWDAEMVEYPAVYEHDGVKHLLYCGNGFGASGIGHAVEAR